MTRPVAPTDLERTVAGIVSGTSTRVYIGTSPDGATNGAYDPKSDIVSLYPVHGDYPPLAVALEEAGHSRAREDYLKHYTRWTRIEAELAMIDPRTNCVINWLEDARIYLRLKADYPGAADMLDEVWRLRHKELTSTEVADDTPAAPILVKVMEFLGQVVADYFNNTACTSFAQVLARAEAFAEELRRLARARSTTGGIPNIPPIPSPGKNDVSGKGASSKSADSEGGDKDEDADNEGDDEGGDKDEGADNEGGKGAGDDEGGDKDEGADNEGGKGAGGDESGKDADGPDLKKKVLWGTDPIPAGGTVTLYVPGVGAGASLRVDGASHVLKWRLLRYEVEAKEVS